jgi:monovalent cation/hydrogen antiporter
MHLTSEWDFSALVVSAVVILARFVWSYPTAYLSARQNFRGRRANPAPTWQGVFAVSFTGIRGIVSLAPALALPLAVAGGGPFPDRDLILSPTFSVILVTLVGQGLMQPLVIQALGPINTGLHEQDAARAEEHRARQRAIEAALDTLDKLSQEGCFTSEVVEGMRAQYQDRLRTTRHSGDSDASHGELGAAHDEIELALIEAERHKIYQLFRKGKLNDEARRRIERELDLGEAQLLNDRSEDMKQSSAPPR